MHTYVRTYVQLHMRHIHTHTLLIVSKLVIQLAVSVLPDHVTLSPPK